MSGGGKSSTSNQTTSSYYDNRSVVDAGGGIVGTGNTWDQSTNLTSISVDGGAINAIKSMGIAQTEAARDIAIKGAASGSAAMDFARQAQEDASSYNKAALDRSMDLSDSAQKFAMTANDAALSFAGKNFDKVLGMTQDVVKQASTNASNAADVARSAYQSAADTAAGNKTLIYVAIGAVALVGVVAAAIAFK